MLNKKIEACKGYFVPHLKIEYTDNMGVLFDVDEFIKIAHEAALDTGVFKLGALRTRASCRAHYMIADGAPDNAFVYVELRVGHGRSTETLNRAGEALFAAMGRYLDPVFEAQPIGLSLEIIEINPKLSFKRNNTHQYMEVRNPQGKA